MKVLFNEGLKPPNHN